MFLLPTSDDVDGGDRQLCVGRSAGVGATVPHHHLRQQSVREGPS